MTAIQRRKPAYLLISDALREKIETGQLRPGDRLPTERELVQEFGVARMTVRHALDILQIEGLIDRRRGRTGGTFVRSIPPVAELTTLDDIYPQLSSRGTALQTRVLDFQRTTAPRHIAAQLEIDDNDEVWALWRLRSTELSPVSLAMHYLPVEFFPDLASSDLEGMINSLGVLKRELVTPALPTEDEQSHLLIGRTQPVLRLSRTVWGSEGRVVEHSEETLRSDAVTVAVVVGDRPAATLESV
ncbi:GntR family transcriptional regulator [Corynebacterium phoceense]|uniref:GntR family transcriptional regulator n=1 Tax=Corynebacterium phoceense TaxID=1686286 RepID=UPI000839B67C|nr:GntR family transcriptional regulator [Corynebacterium phoceense]